MKTSLVGNCKVGNDMLTNISWIKRLFFLKNGPIPASFLFSFGLFKQTIQFFLQIINVKKCHVHPVYGTGIQTHNLRNVSLLP